MNPTRLLGALALAAGASLLVSEPLIGREVFFELTGTSATHLRVICIVAILLGALAIGLGVREEHEHTYHTRTPTTGGTRKCGISSGC